MKTHDLPCCIVEDLLPNYIEHLTSQNSDEKIKSHLNHCEHCQKKLLQLQSPLQPAREPSLSTDAAAVAFFRKTKRKTMRQIWCAIGVTLLVCVVAVYTMILHQFPFHFTVENLYRLSDGSIYFELQAIAPESNISSISYHDGFDHSGSDYSIHMGYSLYTLLQAKSGAKDTEKRYAFTIPAEIVSRISGDGQLVYRQNQETLVIWDGECTLPSAPEAIELQTASISSPFSVIK